jgi:hypothetical protein
MKNLQSFLDRPVYVEWVDSYAAHGWKRPIQSGEVDFKPIKSVGILIGFSKTGITISTSTTDEGFVLDQLTIPMEVVRKIEKLSSRRIRGGKLSFG